MTAEFKLPYRFDTTLTGRVLVLGMSSGVVLMLGIAFIVLPLLGGMDADTLLILQIALGAVALTDLALLPFLFERSGGARGEIDRGRIQIEADHFLGMTSNAPTGLFSPNSFSHVGTARAGKNGTLRKVVLTGVAPIGKFSLAIMPPETADAFVRFLSENLPLKLET